MRSGGSHDSFNGVIYHNLVIIGVCAAMPMQNTRATMNNSCNHNQPSDSSKNARKILVLFHNHRQRKCNLLAHKAINLNDATGTTNGIHITSNGHVFIVPRPGGVVYIIGKADFVTANVIWKCNLNISSLCKACVKAVKQDYLFLGLLIDRWLEIIYNIFTIL